MDLQAGDEVILADHDHTSAYIPWEVWQETKGIKLVRIEVIGRPVSKIKKQLFDDFGIDTRPMSTFSLNAIRISFGIYITKKDIDYLVNALDIIAS